MRATDHETPRPALRDFLEAPEFERPMSMAPAVTDEKTADGVRLALAGGWTIDAGAQLEKRADALVALAGGARAATIDLQRVDQMDTAGAWVIDRSRQSLAARGVEATIVGARPEHAILLREAHFRPTEAPPRREPPTLSSLVADIGESVCVAGADIVSGLGFLGRMVSVGATVAVRPRRWRWTSTVYHLESFSLRSAPIILLINFLVGAIVAQQGIFQLARFNATAFTVDLIGILVLRELGVLLTSIMIAGRSGSAITAEIGAMKMREEVDALTVMALDPMEVLILPRILALIAALPLLTFLADMASLFGGLCVAWAYGGISPVVFLARLHDAIGLNTFAVGLIKAPFMALVIGLIASVEGFAVSGSAESLGRKVTDSVVKSIFMVIVIDGLFAMFFAAVRF
jgi:phospholipid/cholesterol/gamma-HCH transport system permease protein